MQTDEAGYAEELTTEAYMLLLLEGIAKQMSDVTTLLEEYRPLLDKAKARLARQPSSFFKNAAGGNNAR